MCDTCGCGEPGETATIHKPGTAPEPHHHHDHPHSGHDHHQGHAHRDSPSGRTVEIKKDILSKNNLLAERNRGYFESRNIHVLNLVSSPGSGKTTLLERILSDLKNDLNLAVIEGDQQTTRDADRIASTGVPVLQVNTGVGCHLDANMIYQSIQQLDLQTNSVLFIENVGNLICPALFDLGEAKKVVIISVTEGDDKPHKYPTMFSVADICLINKIDLLPYVEFDVQACREYALQVNPDLRFFEVSAKTGAGLEDWKTWIRETLQS